MPLFYFNVRRNGIDDPPDGGHEFSNKELAVREACRAISDGALEAFEQMHGDIEIVVSDADDRQIAKVALQTQKLLF